MAKLIHATSLAAFKTAYTDWASSSSPIYNSIAYTDDGYMYTHGGVFQLSVVGAGNPWGLGFTLSGQTASVTVAGNTQSITLPVVGISNGSTSDFSITSNAGVFTITHINKLTATTVGPSAASDITLSIPELTISATGHITAASQYTATLNHVLQAADSTTTKGYLLFGTGAGTAGTLYNTGLYINSSTGAVYVPSLYIGGTAIGSIYAPIAHASSATTYGVGTSSLYGHLKLSDATSSSSDTTGGTAATPNAVLTALNAAKQYAHDLLGSSDAMMFVGTIDGTGVFKSYNSTVITQAITVNTTKISDLTAYSAGWTFKVTTSGTITGIGNVEAGDMVICVSDKATSYSAADFTVVQANLDGAVTIASSLATNALVLGSSATTIHSLTNGTSGQFLKMGASGPEWNTVPFDYRAIQVNGTALLASSATTPLNLVAGTGVSIAGNSSTGAVTITNTGIISTYGLTINSGSTVLGTYDPKTAAATLKFTNGLSGSYATGVYTIGHSNSITAKSQALYPIAIDAYGHVTSVGTAVTALPSPTSLTFSDGGTAVDTYNGGTAKILNFIDGANSAFTVTTASNVISVKLDTTMLYRPISYTPNSGTSTPTTLLTNSVATALELAAGNNITMSGSGGVLTINATDTNTWRNVTAYSISGSAQSGPAEILSSSIGTSDLEFGSEFLWNSSENGGTLHLGWAEVASDGTVTYSV